MSLANTPVINICYDDANRSKILITGYYLGGVQSSNTTIKSNTLFGANTSMNCILEVYQVEGTVDLANGGMVQLQYVSSGNQNTDILIAGGGGNMVHLDGIIPNNANTPTGDLNLFLNNVVGNSSYTLMITVGKQNLGLGAYGNAANYGAGAWANGFALT